MGPVLGKIQFQSRQKGFQEGYVCMSGVEWGIGPQEPGLGSSTNGNAGEAVEGWCWGHRDAGSRERQDTS